MAYTKCTLRPFVSTASEISPRPGEQSRLMTLIESAVPSLRAALKAECTVDNAKFERRKEFDVSTREIA